MPSEIKNKNLKIQLEHAQRNFSQERSRCIGLETKVQVLSSKLADCQSERDSIGLRFALLHEQYAAEITSANATIEDQDRINLELSQELESLKEERTKDQRRLKEYERDYGALALSKLSTTAQIYCYLAELGSPIGRFTDRFLRNFFYKTPQFQKIETKLNRPVRKR